MNGQRAIIFAALAVGACGEETPTEQDRLPELPASVTSPREPQAPLTSDHGEVPGLQVASRGPRRMSVEELARSWEAVADLAPGSVVIPDNLARSLGQPDWLTTTVPSLEPSPLFMKFMVDLSGILCSNIIQGDRLKTEDQRVVLKYPNEVDRNLRQLILRFWAIDARAEDHPDVARLRTVFEAGQAGAAGNRSGWLAVCMALTTAPEFLLY